MPLVSVIMSVYNGDKHLEESLSSIINQSFLDWELIANDFSKDNSGKIIQRAMQEDDEFVVLKQREPRACRVPQPSHRRIQWSHSANG